jgi:uncharacterized repeat protein (TIGR03803 family)
MRLNKSCHGRQGSNILIAATITLMLTLFAPNSYAQYTETILHGFSGTSDGGNPWAGVIFDAAGNLYGTTAGGGANQGGTVYELSPSASGWLETILYSFKQKSDGGDPLGGLVLDSSGNLYGTAYMGGENKTLNCQPNGCGAIYKLSPVEGGGWTESVIHTFSTAAGGFGPVSGLTIDTAGNLYGTTIYGGQLYSGDPIGYGLVYELSPSSAGWKYKILHAFSNGVDGSIPYAGVTLDAAGNLYAAAMFGGNSRSCSGNSCGTIVKLSPTSSGPWNTSLVHNFVGKDGGNPYGGLAIDAAGNLYATTENYGAENAGTVVEFSPSGSGWKESLLYTFSGQGTAGIHPQGKLTTDSGGNVYGTTTSDGGTFDAEGTVFELSPSGSAWNLTVLHSFDPVSEGAYPISGVILDSSGNLYGTTSSDPSGSGAGNVYELTP